LEEILQLGLELDCSRALHCWRQFLHLYLSWARICRGNNWYLPFHRWIAVVHFISIFELIIINEVSGFRVFWVVFARGLGFS